MVTDWDPYASANILDPYPMHAALRALGPVVHFARYGAWGLVRHAEVSAALRDHETFVSGRGVGLRDFRKEPSRVLPKRMVLEIDPPEHGVGRRILSGAMSPPPARRLRADFEAAAEALAEALVARREIDAVPDLAEAYPLAVLPDAVGIRKQGRENLLIWSSAVFNAMGPDNALAEEWLPKGLAAYPWVIESCRRDLLAPGGLGETIYAAADAAGLGEEEGALLVRPFLTAGIDTTVSGIGNAILAFAQHPGEWQKLRADPEQARRAFEEALRWESPVQGFFRTASRPVEVAGTAIPADAKVLMMMGAANRDPARFADPDRFDIGRDIAGHLGFGTGIHGCVGQMIARLEGELILKALARRVARIEIAGAPGRKPNNSLRALSSLPVVLHPA